MSSSDPQEPRSERPQDRAAAGRDAAHAAGERAAANTILRAGGEIVGKLASLVVFAIIARRTGASGLGLYVLALAWGEVAMTPVGLGIDRYLLRLLAADLTRLDALYWNAVVLKVARGVPICVAAAGLAFVLYGGQQAAVIAIVVFATLLDTLARTQMNVFYAFERGGLVAFAIAAQRIIAAALGVAALFAGFGVVGVGVAFWIGCAIRLALSHALLARLIRSPARVLPADARADLRKRSLPYIAQDMFGLVIARGDVLLLSALASKSVVGDYGAAYRLLDSTSFIAQSLQGAFSAMYTYLSAETVPTLRAVFQRSIKASLVLLMPITVAFCVLAGPIIHAFYGPKLAGAAEPLRLLAPVVVLFALYALCSTLVAARRDAWDLLRVMSIAAIANLVLNLAMIPIWGADGAAVAMTLSSAVFVALGMRLSLRESHGIDVVSLLASPLVASAAMAVPMLALRSTLVPALAAGALTYLVVIALIERIAEPDDYAFALRLLRRALPARRAGAPA